MLLSVSPLHLKGGLACKANWVEVDASSDPSAKAEARDRILDLLTRTQAAAKKAVRAATDAEDKEELQDHLEVLDSLFDFLFDKSQ